MSRKLRSDRANHHSNSSISQNAVPKYSYRNRGNEPEKPFLLAGGIGPDNISEAVRRCSPFGVDLSSAVETDGKKDREKIMAAVAAVRSIAI